MTTRVLVADDDLVVRDMVRRYLEREGMAVAAVGDGHEALRVLDSGQVDIAVIDVLLPGVSGLALVRNLRRSGDFSMPVILLTALGEEEDRIAGLEAGADDYVTKPFSPRELTLRVRSLLRRAPAPATPQPSEITAGAITISTAARTATVAGKPVGLTNREFDLLVFFLTHRDTVFSRQELLNQVWCWDYGDLSTVTVHVKRLRAKLGAYHQIHTVWGRGYFWRDAPAAQDANHDCA